jgi:DNA-binding transcriptional regulator GbsR (MarR family)
VAVAERRWWALDIPIAVSNVSVVSEREVEMDPEARTQFIESWGTMGVAWGINRSMARIHALLMLSHEPVCLDDIATMLEISRGNASMSLQKLRDWGVIRKAPIAGDRRDYYVTEPDVWSMFFAIARERKRREFDPAVSTVHQAIEALGDDTAPEVQQRLAQMAKLLGTGEQVLERFLANPTASRALLAFLAAGPQI